MFHLVSYKWIRKTQVIPEFGGFYKEVGFYLEGSEMDLIVEVRRNKPSTLTVCFTSP